MKSKLREDRRIRVWMCLLLGVSALFFAMGCRNPSDSDDSDATGTSAASTASVAYKSYLYMTDTSNGKVYYYNPSSHTGSSSSLVTTSTKAAGEIKFYKGIGYVAMGYGGIYYFDPSASTPSATLVAGSSGLNAQYFAFSSSTKAYVSVAISSTSDTGAVYWFNPSNPSAGVTQVAASTADKYMQEIIVGPDNCIYVAECNSQAVLKINPSTDTVSATYAAKAPGTTGLAAGSFGGKTGVFVANNGLDSSWTQHPGSVDFIDTDGNVSSVIAPSASSPIYPSRMVTPSSSTLIASGYGYTYFIALSGTASVSKTATFGSFSISYDSSSGLVYVPVNVWNTSNKLYVFDTSGNQQSYSPVSVMTTSDNIAYAAFYQE